MALSSALFSGISGLGTLGNAMQIIGDNISNVNTVGFKSSQFTFQDLLSQSVSTLSGTSQIGRGTALGDIYASFEQGSFETTGNTTDLAIGGEGFFVLREEAGETLYYSRAGNFRFNKDGYLTNPEGYIAQGWELDADGDNVGSVTDILLSSFTSSPQESEKIKAIVNLDSDGNDNSTDLVTPDAALSIAWDGTDPSPLSENAYEYQTTLKAYDSLGSTHDISIYFDKADTASAYEFIVTCNPNEDNRAGVSGNADQGLLARGLIHFNPGSGVINDIDVFNINPADGSDIAGVLTDGYYTFAPVFLSGSPMSIGLDFGSRNDGTSWVNGSLSNRQFAIASTGLREGKGRDGY